MPAGPPPKLIRISIEQTDPVAGTAVTEGHEPLRFDGWLQLLRALSELVGQGEATASG